MDSTISTAVSSLISLAVTQYTQYLIEKSKDANWKPSQADVDGFMAKIQSDTPEAVKARVAASLGIPWPPQIS